MASNTDLLGTAKALVRDGLDQVLTRVGLAQSEAALTRDAQSYWSNPSEKHWADNSHFRLGGDLGEEAWNQIGQQHLDLWRRCARFMSFERPLQRVVEWGCGGGANAVQFAPLTSDVFIGVDVADRSVYECQKEVEAVCDTPFVPVVIDVASPELATRAITDPVDLILCLYVFELIPTPEYGRRLLRIFRDLLADDGLALVQIKYRTRSWLTAPRRRRYRGSTVASMTTYRIEEFWTAASACGLKPELVTLVPKNPLDERYGYFLLSRS